MRFGVSIPPFTDATTVVDLAVAADAAGWDGVFLWDHIQWVPEMKLDVHDPWALLAAIAVRTERVRLGTCVTPLARRRPWIVAKQLTTLDHLSRGRAVLGVGLGEPPDADFAAFGDPGDPRERGARLDDGLAVLGALLSGEPVEHNGPHYSVHAQLRPPPVQRPRPPIFVAGVAPHRRPLDRALRWNGFFPIGSRALLTPDEIAEFLADVNRPVGWDLYAGRTAEHEPAAFEAVGVTWLVEAPWPMGDWVPALRATIAAGPPR